jgi:hypothetical protein
MWWRLALRLAALRENRIRVPLTEALPCDIGADERCVHVGDLTPGDTRLDAGPHRQGGDLLEQLGSSALPNASERRVVGRSLV